MTILIYICSNVSGEVNKGQINTCDTVGFCIAEPWIDKAVLKYLFKHKNDLCLNPL